MSSRKRSKSRERRGGESKASSKLRMDSKAPTPRITAVAKSRFKETQLKDPSLPAGRRREIDNVMKKARASPNSNAYWDKKLLEVEAKDPNRSRSISMSRSRSKVHAKHASPKVRSRPRPPSPSPLPRRVPRPMTPPPVRKPLRAAASDKPTDPRRQPPPPRPRNPSGEIINVSGITPPSAMKKSIRKKDKPVEPILLTRIKKERTKKRPGSPDSSGSEDSSTSSLSPIVATTRLTLSERFGKMAQWSIDRERRDIENMRITKNSSGGDLKVMIEEDDFLYGSPPRRYSHSPVPPGHYPDELLSSGPSGLASWDDVRVRYQYYKDLGYLRDLSLDDYVKWEEWWYKYQDWLANERHYEHWLSTQRRGKNRLPASQRLN